MRFDIVTLFPDFFRGPLDYGVLERALRTGLASVHTHNLRDFTHDRHRTVDDRPFGGGEGMVLKPQPIFECLTSLGVAAKPGRPRNQRVILLSAQGRRFHQSAARRLAALDRVVLICGRYEGVDERVSQLLCDEELSIGDFVLSGGELAAAVVVDAVVRLLPGALGHADSSRYESFGEGDQPSNSHPDPAQSKDCHPDPAQSKDCHPDPAQSKDFHPDPAQSKDCHPDPAQSKDCHPEERSDEGSASRTADGVPRATHASAGLLDYPHYTRPAEWQGLAVPEELSGGDHLAVRRWRRQAALAKTLANRPDLLANADLSDDDREYLAGLGFSG